MIVRGSAEQLARWLQPATGKFMPHAYIFAIPADSELPRSLAEKSASDAIRAYLCEGMQCSPPISSRHEWDDLIENVRARL